MGRKGVSKRKPKKSEAVSNTGNSGTSKLRSGNHSPVQSLVKDKDTSAGSNKTQKKR